MAGRRTQLTYPGTGLYVNYDYLVTGEVSKIRENGATTGVGVLATFGYDDLGRRTSLTYGNGVVTSYGFDAVSRLASLTQNLSSTTNDLTLGFSYNPASQIVSNTRSNDLFAWTGHGSGTTAATANGLNRLTAVGSAVPTYDARGNMTSDGTTTFAYTLENMMKTAGTFTLDYDPAMRLYQMDSAATSAVRFGYDGQDMIAEYNGSNAVQRRYVHGPGSDEPLVWYEGSGTTDRRFLQADERGSIVAVTGSTGAPITNGINKYDEYGVPQGTLTGRFGYTGQAWLPEVGLYYYKARMYQPKLARFMQTDPIGYSGGMNIYAYAGGDPVNTSDPTGTDNEGSKKLHEGCVRYPMSRICDPNATNQRDAQEKALDDYANAIGALATLDTGGFDDLEADCSSGNCFGSGDAEGGLLSASAEDTRYDYPLWTQIFFLESSQNLVLSKHGHGHGGGGSEFLLEFSTPESLIALHYYAVIHGVEVARGTPPGSNGFAIITDYPTSVGFDRYTGLTNRYVEYTTPILNFFGKFGLRWVTNMFPRSKGY